MAHRQFNSPMVSSRRQTRACIWTGPRFFRSNRPQQLIAGEVVCLKTLAADDVLHPTEIRRLLAPPVSVPTIVEAILAGNVSPQISP
jgi:hypothetical protein